MISSQAESYLGDYLGSEHFLFLDPALKQSAEEILRAFFDRAQTRGIAGLEDLDAKTVEAILLQDLGKLALPPAVKRALPDLLEGFFGYLQSSGRWPGAEVWSRSVAAAAERFRGAIRSDGSVRGETFKKQYSDVGRNDPCPCGSGKKFKKCCGPLIGL